jgi:hypothetical protein
MDQRPDDDFMRPASNDEEQARPSRRSSRVAQPTDFFRAGRDQNDRDRHDREEDADDSDDGGANRRDPRCPPGTFPAGTHLCNDGSRNMLYSENRNKNKYGRE